VPLVPIALALAAWWLVSRYSVPIKLSEHFYGYELLTGSAARGGRPSALHVQNARLLARTVLEPIRAAVSARMGKDTPIRITSWWRSPAGNASLSQSVSDSLHLEALAVDMDVDGLSAAELADIVRGLELEDVDVLTYDDGHVHVELDER
jgi:hypothetical protein